MRNALLVPILIVGVVVAAAAYLVMTKGSNEEPVLRPAAESRGVQLQEQKPVATAVPTKAVTATPTPTPEEKVVTGRFSAEEDQVGADTQVFAVEFTESGVVPAQQRVRVGDIVLFRNTSSQAVRPVSAAYPFSAPGPLKPGDEFQVTFTKQGSWNFVNDLAPAQTGIIVVGT